MGKNFEDAIKLIYQIDERTKIMLERDYISRNEFHSEIKRIEQEIRPVEMVSFGLVGLVCMVVIGALIKNAFKHAE